MLHPWRCMAVSLAAHWGSASIQTPWRHGLADAAALARRCCSRRSRPQRSSMCRPTGTPRGKMRRTARPARPARQMETTLLPQKLVLFFWAYFEQHGEPPIERYCSGLFRIKFPQSGFPPQESGCTILWNLPAFVPFVRKKHGGRAPHVAHAWVA